MQMFSRVPQLHACHVSPMSHRHPALCPCCYSSYITPLRLLYFSHLNTSRSHLNTLHRTDLSPLFTSDYCTLRPLINTQKSEERRQLCFPRKQSTDQFHLHHEIHTHSRESSTTDFFTRNSLNYSHQGETTGKMCMHENCAPQGQHNSTICEGKRKKERHRFPPPHVYLSPVNPLKQWRHEEDICLPVSLLPLHTTRLHWINLSL